jgi:hypothetical protein
LHYTAPSQGKLQDELPGEHDPLIKVWSRSIAGLDALVKRIRSVDGIKALLEMVVAGRIKENTPPIPG